VTEAVTDVQQVQTQALGVVDEFSRERPIPLALSPSDRYLPRSLSQCGGRPVDQQRRAASV
jgi:hypothetical protein